MALNRGTHNTKQTIKNNKPQTKMYEARQDNWHHSAGSGQWFTRCPGLLHRQQCACRRGSAASTGKKFVAWTCCRGSSACKRSRLVPASCRRTLGRRPGRIPGLGWAGEHPRQHHGQYCLARDTSICRPQGARSFVGPGSSAAERASTEDPSATLNCHCTQRALFLLLAHSLQWSPGAVSASRRGGLPDRG